jgi:hypothetical protein
MPSRTPDDSLNLEDSGTLELNRPVTARQPDDVAANGPAPELTGKRRQGDSKSRELLMNPFDAPHETK